MVVIYTKMLGQDSMVEVCRRDTDFDA